MKLHYPKILLFFFLLNVLVTSYQVYNNNEPYVTPHHIPIYTSRVLSEKDIPSSIYNKDEEMKSVKENFDRRTSQRFEEYKERMKEKRQKRKEQRDKNIQKIIHKDKMEKNLAEKIEKGCLRCGCGLGGVAGSIGLFGGIAINMWKPGALKIAIDKAIAAGATKIAEAAKAMGDAAGAAKVIELIQSKYVLSTLNDQTLGSYFATTSYKNASVITQAVKKLHYEKCTFDSSGIGRFLYGDGNRHIPICRSVWQQTQAVSQQGQTISQMKVIETTVQTMVSDAEVSAKAAEAAKSAELTAAIKAREAGVINTIFMSKQTAIIASVVAILIIALVMIIIYLILRYRRKKKMKKKAQYTKLLNE
ncbi:rifin PIR protein,putative [Plasmodium sp. DRC-Itaito]|nr:rifin PIR protein,putative [Plasmodium sp. DRC-Itaito]